VSYFSNDYPFEILFLGVIERTAGKLRNLRLSTTSRKSRSKRISHAPPSPHLLQSPAMSEGRNSTSSASNTTGFRQLNFFYDEICLKVVM
jgi:hypothetical protein